MSCTALQNREGSRVPASAPRPTRKCSSSRSAAAPPATHDADTWQMSAGKRVDCCAQRRLRFGYSNYAMYTFCKLHHDKTACGIEQGTQPSDGACYAITSIVHHPIRILRTVWYSRRSAWHTHAVARERPTFQDLPLHCLHFLLPLCFQSEIFNGSKPERHVLQSPSVTRGQRSPPVAVRSGALQRGVAQPTATGERLHGCFRSRMH